MLQQEDRSSSSIPKKKMLARQSLLSNEVDIWQEDKISELQELADNTFPKCSTEPKGLKSAKEELQLKQFNESILCMHA